MGERGPQGERGLQGERGERGFQGEPGEPGLNGAAGRDATFAQPVTWQENKLYAYGTVARHAGGLWYAARDTDGVPGVVDAGWLLLLDGIAALDFVDIDDKHVAIELTRTSGAKSQYVKRMGTFEYRGVYKAGTEYHKNDGVTFDGSMWIARVDKPATEPGTTEAADEWTLAVKRGKNGRDGINFAGVKK
jgi:hypothetical protein